MQSRTVEPVYELAIGFNTTTPSRPGRTDHAFTVHGESVQHRTDRRPAQGR